MNVEQLVVFLVIGGIAGWLAATVMKGGGFGIVGNVVTGILGAILGGWIFGLLGISVGGAWLGPLITATVGAIVLLYLARFIKK
jgi:uncharacterized membrane protein YeaQ/YmgE (transglycosylase-associated protein family)